MNPALAWTIVALIIAADVLPLVVLAMGWGPQ